MTLRRRALIGRAAAAGAVSTLAGAARAQPDALGAPALVLDFATGTLPRGVAFARPSPAWGSLLGGAIRRFGADEPRFEREPASGAALGLLIEGQTTNLLRRGSDFPRWNMPGSVSVAPATDVAAPDGGGGVFRLRAGEIAKVDQGLLHWSQAPVGDGFLSASVFVRAVDPGVEQRWAIAQFDYASYRQDRAVATAGATWTRIACATPWYAFDTGSKVVNLSAPFAGAGAPREILIWGAQFEAGHRPTTLAGLRGETILRRADEVHADLAALAGPEGTIAMVLPSGLGRGGVLLDAGDLRVAINFSGRVEARVGRLALDGLGDVSDDTIVEIAWSPGGAAVRTGRENALVPRARVAGDPGRLALSARSRLLAGADGTRPANGHLLRLAGWRRARPAEAPVAPIYAPKTYEIAFADEFDDADVARINENAVPSSGKAPAWRSRYRHERFTIINKEKQIYVDREFRGTGPAPLGVQPFAIRDSVLTITAERADPARVRPFLKNAGYTSGCITTEFTFSQQFGYFEIRCRCPLGKGFWPAFWLLPVRKAWPPEIDPLEASGVRRFSAHQGCVGDKKHQPRWIEGVVDISDGFHAYAVEWTESDIIFSIDGRESFRQPNFVNEPMYMLANLAVGSHDPKWIPDPDETTPFPGRFEIDSIRAWRRRT